MVLAAHTEKEAYERVGETTSVGKSLLTFMMPRASLFQIKQNGTKTFCRPLNALYLGDIICPVFKPKCCTIMIVIIIAMFYCLFSRCF